MGERIDIETAGTGPVGGWLARPEGETCGALNRDVDPSAYKPLSAMRARERTLKLFRKALR